tara:strand:+ start:1819 stop:5118 length:3300 start_codon:yes stop_codon:yes gene_type:complete
MGTKSFRRALDEQRRGEDGLRFVSRALDLLAQKDEILDHGPFLAFVLRVEIQEGANPKTSDNDWLSMLQAQEATYQSSAGGTNKQGKLPNPVRGIKKMIVTARVAKDIFPRTKISSAPGSFPQPDIHAWIPFPQQFGNITEVDAVSNYYISQHTQFISESESVFEYGIPAPGSLVLVDWIKKGQDGPRMPIYKKPLRTGQSGTKSLNPDCDKEKNKSQTNPPPGGNKKQKTHPGNNKKGKVAPPPPAGFRNYPIYSHLTPRLRGKGIIQGNAASKNYFKSSQSLLNNINYLLASMQVMQYYVQDLALSGWIQKQFKICSTWPGVRAKVYYTGNGGATYKGHAKASQHKTGKAVDFGIKIFPVIDKNNAQHQQIMTDYVTAHHKRSFMKWRKKRKSRRRMSDADASIAFAKKGVKLSYDFAYAVIASLVVKGKIKDGGWGTYKNGSSRTGTNRPGKTYYDSYKNLSTVPVDSTHWDYKSNRRWMWVAVGSSKRVHWFKKYWKAWRKKNNLTKSQASKMKLWMKFQMDSNFTTPQVDSWYNALTVGAGAAFGQPIPSPETVLKYWTDNNLILRVKQKPYDKSSLKIKIPPVLPTPTSTSQVPPPASATPPVSTATVMPPPKQGPGTTGAQHRAMSMGNVGTPVGGGGGAASPAAAASAGAGVGNTAPGTAASKAGAAAAKIATKTTPKKSTPSQPNAECEESQTKSTSKSQTSKKNTNANKNQIAPGKSQPVANAPAGTIQYPSQKLEWQKKKYNTALKATMLVIHETGKSKPAYHVAKENFERSQKRKKDGAGWMHFYGGRAGEIIQQLPTNSPALHANWASTNAIGYEVCNLGAISSTSSLLSKTKINKLGYKILGPEGNVGGKLGNGKVKSLGLYPGKNYALPGEKQCLRVWETIKWLVGTSKPHPELALSIVFPAVLNDTAKTIGTGLHSSKLGGSSKEKVFVWGRFNPLKPPFYKNGNYMSSWKKGQPSTFESRLAWKVEKPFQRGIVGHHRWQDNDGCFIEFYCLGRALGMTSPDAYFAAIGALAMTSDKNATGAKNVTFLPDYKKANYVKTGRDIWGNNGDINWKQWMSSIPLALPKDRDKKYETGVGIYEKFI